MSHYGDLLVAGKVTMITGMICTGPGQGVQPLLLHCIGANNGERYRKCLRFPLVFSFVISSVMTILCYVFINQTVGAFLTDVTAFSAGVQFSRIVLTTSFLSGIYYVLVNALQATGNGWASLIVNISRQGLVCTSSRLTSVKRVFFLHSLLPMWCPLF